MDVSHPLDTITIEINTKEDLEKISSMKLDLVLKQKQKKKKKTNSAGYIIRLSLY